MRSGLCMAIRLGTSSPSTIDTNVMKITTSVSASESAYGVSAGTVASRLRTGARSVTPPATPTSTLTKVIPIWTVERNRFGFSINCRTVFARLSPSLTRCCNRALREEATDISDNTKIAFTRMIARIIMISVVMFIKRIGSLFAPDCRVKRVAGTDKCPVHLPSGTDGKIWQMYMTIYGDF